MTASGKPSCDGAKCLVPTTPNMIKNQLQNFTHKFTLDWTIQNFKSDERNHGAIKSPAIKSAGGQWYVALAPIKDETIAVYLKFRKSKPGRIPVSLEWTVRLGTPSKNVGNSALDASDTVGTKENNHTVTRRGKMDVPYASESDGSTFQQKGCFDFMKFSKFWDTIDTLMDDKGSLLVSATVKVIFRDISNDAYADILSNKEEFGGSIELEAKSDRGAKRKRNPDITAVLPIAPKGATVAVKNEEGGWWLALLTEPLLDGRNPSKTMIGVRWYDEVPCTGANKKSKIAKYTLSETREQIVAAAIHPDPRPFKMIPHKKGLYVLQEPDAIDRLKKKYSNQAC